MKYNKKFQSTAGSTVFFKGHFLSKFSVFAEFTVHLPAATEFGVSFKEKRAKKQKVQLLLKIHQIMDARPVTDSPALQNPSIKKGLLDA